jgi:hypothetical protein
MQVTLQRSQASLITEIRLLQINEITFWDYVVLEEMLKLILYKDIKSFKNELSPLIPLC